MSTAVLTCALGAIPLQAGALIAYFAFGTDKGALIASFTLGLVYYAPDCWTGWRARAVR